MVFVRYVLQASTIWQTEFVLYSVVAATLVGSPYVLSVGGHVNVDLVSQMLGPRMRRALNATSYSLALLFCVVLAWSAWQYFHDAWSQGWVTESVWAPPLWMVLLPFPVGIALLCLQYGAEIYRLFGADGHDDAVPQDPDPLR